MFHWPSTLDASPALPSSRSTSTLDARRSFAAELVSHLKTHGFARVRNCGVAPATVKELFDYHRQFFDLPLPVKLSIRHPGGEVPARGYSPWAFEKSAILRPDLHAAPSLAPGVTIRKQDTIPCSPTPSQHANILSETAKKFESLLDAREQFAVGPPKDTAFPTPQLSGEFLPEFNSVMENAYGNMEKACRMLVDVIEEGLNAPPGSISSRTSDGESGELNLNFYPEVDKDTLEDSMRRIWPHSDIGVVSALLQASTGANGLELEVREAQGSEFAPVAIEQEGDMIILVSDTLERWTNGYLRAAVHRVGLPPVLSSGLPASGKKRVPERRSAVMFYRAPATMTLSPIPHFVSANNPARYEDIASGEYLKQFNRRLY